ncbi:GEVED domain-containing protein [Bizionia myxarmorum]|uniref:T9SS type A sorting domain-containing protein n=1 Tax=Bizionia myxarmorum TaxID=291186 RepID=A0A5D0RCA9_9FLAO|nr:GEVED domain-containing protein [Bizionia myxarmorum]TYB78511.1 T9SS type A sorting domain-containing protein [Bizionia myxarmorum]
MKKITMLFLATVVSTLMWVPSNAQIDLQLSSKQTTIRGTQNLSHNSGNFYRGAGDNNTVIFEQVEGGGNGIVSDYYIPIDSGAYSADDFALTAETDVHLMQFQGFGNDTAGLESVLGGFQLYVYADTGGAPAGYPSGPNPAILELDLNWDAVNGPDAGLSYEKIEEDGFFPVYIVTFDIEEALGNVLTLAAGNYWVVIAAKINGPTSSARFNWITSNDINGALPKLSDPQALFGSDASWLDLNVLTAGTDFNALAFTVYGPLLPDCNGIPDAGITIVNPASGNEGSTYTVSAQGTSGAPGISFQWQSNTNSAGWIDEGAATTGYAAYTATAPTQLGDVVEWRLASTCVATTDTAYSDVATFTVAISYCEAAGGSTTFENIANVTYAGINNTTTAHAGYNNFTAQIGSVMQGSPNQISVTITADSDDFVYAFIDWNQNGTLDDAGEVYTIAPGTSSVGPHTMDITVPTDAVLGNTRMRVKVGWNESTPNPCGTFSYGEIEDYTVLVGASQDCSGTPDAGIASVSPSVGNINSTYTVSASGLTLGNGLTYQWQSNTDGAGWVDEGVLLTQYAAFTATAPAMIEIDVEWRLITTCTISSESATSSVATFTTAVTYCNVNFPSAVEPITYVNFGGIDNTTSAVVGGSPALEDFTSLMASVFQGEMYPIEIKGNTDGGFTSKIVVYIDWNQDGVFDNAVGSEEMYTLPDIVGSTGEDAISSVGSIAVPASAMLGNTTMRVMKKFNSVAAPCNAAGFGQAEDYTILVEVASDCSGTPDGGIAIVNPVTGNAGSSYTVTATGYTTGNGLTYQWQSNTNSAGWVNEGGLETSYAAFTATASSVRGIDIEWRLEVTCTISVETSYSAIATFTTSAVTLYCTPTLDCSDGDNILNVTFQEIDNTTTCSPNGYGDFTGMVAGVLSGDTYPISVTVGDGFANESVSVWIDFNDNGSFDQDEFFYIGTGSAQVLTEDIAIPVGLAIGEYRMRVRVAAVSVATATWDMACDESQVYGETEDYTIEVTGAMSVDDNFKLAEARLYPNPINDGTFYIHAPSLNGEQVEVNISDMAGRQVFNNTLSVNNSKVSVSVNHALTSGLYLVTLKHAGESHTFRVVKN